MAGALVYGSMDPSSILALFIVFFPLLWKFSKLGASFRHIMPLRIVIMIKILNVSDVLTLLI